MARKKVSRRRPARAAAPSTGQITADASLAQAQKTAAYFKKLLTDSPMHGAEDSVRNADYKGHHIVVRTTYRVTIDGQLFHGALGVTNGGDVHYHGMPNIGFASAIDLVKAVIDTFPDEFEEGSGGHGHHDHGAKSVRGMSKKKTTRKKARTRAVTRAGR